MGQAAHEALIYPNAYSREIRLRIYEPTPILYAALGLGLGVLGWWLVRRRTR